MGPASERQGADSERIESCTERASRYVLAHASPGFAAEKPLLSVANKPDIVKEALGMDHRTSAWNPLPKTGGGEKAVEKRKAKKKNGHK